MFVFCLLLLVSSVLAAWGDINADNSEENISVESSEVVVPSSSGSSDAGTAEMKYTNEFYIAVFLGVVAVLIILYIIYLLIRGPRVRWNKSKPLKK